jgi:carboxylate-amine ligase
MLDAKKKVHKAFSGYGIEIEYMIVDNTTLEVRPIADKVLHGACMARGLEASGDVERYQFGWSNELVQHVIELKTDGPATNLASLGAGFHGEVNEINRLLEAHGSMLAPTGMHPWMNPDRDTRLWPHDNGEIYAAYNRIFSCKGHGWSNLQSMHINLPFDGDEEFGRLHAAIRLVLPMLPALAAASPFFDGEKGHCHDMRLEFYRRNQARIPEIAGVVIPEAVFTKAAYEREILSRTYRAIAPHDPEGLLQHEWLNSRGAIARFDRSAIEIRLIDTQECPAADIAIAGLVIQLVRDLYDEKYLSYSKQCAWAAADLAVILDDTIRRGELASQHAKTYGKIFGIQNAEDMKALTSRIVERVLQDAPESWVKPLETIREQGTLSTRMLTAREQHDWSLRRIFGDLSECLAANKPFNGIPSQSKKTDGKKKAS